MALVTLAKYKEYLKVSGATIDTQLQDLADAVEKTVKEYLNRDIESATYTEYHDGNGQSELITRQYPITSVTSVSVYDDTVEGDWEALVEGTDYDRLVIRPHEFSFYLDGYAFQSGTHNYKVVYVAGYSTIPLDIQMACKKLMSLRYNESPLKLAYVGMSSVVIDGQQSENYAIDLDAEMRILKSISNHKCVNAGGL